MKYAYIILSLTILLAIAACGAQPEPTPTPRATTTPTEAPNIEVHVGNAPEEGTEHRQSLETRTKEFEEAHPNVDIVFETTKWDPNTFEADLASGNTTDVVVVPATEGQLVIENGYAADITDLMADWPVANDFNEAILQPYMQDGRIYAVPTNIYVLGLFYDKQVFRQAGLVNDAGNVVPPTTWEEFVETARVVTEETDAAGFCTFTKSNQGGWTFMNWGWQAGGEFERLVDGQWQAVFDEAPIVEAMQFIQDLRWEHDVLQEEIPLDAGQSFPMVADHQCGMAIFAPDWFDIVIKQHGGNRDDLGLTVLPAGPAGQASLLGGIYHFISANASPAVQQAAFDWIVWHNFRFLGPTEPVDEARVWLAHIRSLMYKPNSETGRRQREVLTKYPELPYFETYIEEAPKNALPEPPVATQELYATLDGVIQEVLTNENADPQTLLEQAAQEFQAEHLDTP